MCSYTMLHYGKACGGTRQEVWGGEGMWWYKTGGVGRKACGGTRQEVWGERHVVVQDRRCGEKGVWWYKTGGVGRKARGGTRQEVWGDRRVVVQHLVSWVQHNTL